MLKFSLLSRVNIIQTLFVNFKTQNFFVALKFPIIVFGKLKLRNLSGQIRINAPISLGMIRLGDQYLDMFPISQLPTQLWVSGTLEFRGHCIISGGVALFVQSKDAVLSVGDMCTVGGGTLIKSVDSIYIGDKTRITSGCTIMDSNMHYVKNTESGYVKKTWGKITIGHNCWINQGTTISKGTVIPSYSIVARNSFINKDYSEYGENLFLAGSPAISKKGKVQRIFDRNKEVELNRFFRENNVEEYFDGIGLFKTNE